MRFSILLTRFLLFILMGLLAPAAGAQHASGAAVHGIVVDEAGAPLAGASVLLVDQRSDRQRYGTAAGPEGTFAIESVRPGRYLLVVSFVGFADYRASLDVPPSDAREVRVVLQARALPQADVTVTATRARPQLTPITFSNLTAQDLAQLPDMKDLPVLLSTLPSMTYYSENGNGIGYSTLRMRGFDQRRVAVLINGIPENDPEDHNVFWINFFDIQGAIQDIQVQRGAGASFYGPTAIGGAINIVAMPYRPYPYASAEAGYGAFDTRRMSVEANTGLLGGRYVAFGRFSRLRSDGYRDAAWTAFYRFFAGVVRYGKRSTLTLQAYGGPQRDGLAFSGIPKAANEGPVELPGVTIDRRYNASALTRDVENFHQPHLQLFHDWQPAPGWELHQALFAVKGEGYFDFGATFRSADYLRLPADFRNLTAEERALPLFITAPDAAVLFRAYLDQWQVGWMPRLTRHHAAGETTLGAEARLHRSLRWGRVQEAAGLPADVVGPAHDARVYQFRGEKVITSLYGTHLFRPVGALAVQGDLQLTYRAYRQFDEQFFGRRFRVPYVFLNPRLGVTLFPEQPFSLYASAAWAHREPRLKSIYDGEEAGAGMQPQFEREADGALDFSSPLIRPERLFDVELGGALSRTRYRLQANLFYMDFYDEIVPSGGLDQYGVPRTGNADRTRHVGLEMEGAARLVPGLDLYANATLSRNRFIRFTEYDAAGQPVRRDGNPIAGFPEIVANAGVTYTRGGLTAALDVKLAGRQYIDNSGGIGPDGAPDGDLLVDPYALVNAGLRYELPAPSALQGLRLALDMNNVLDRNVLLYGNVGPLGPQFFPAATRHLFASIRYTIR